MELGEIFNCDGVLFKQDTMDFIVAGLSRINGDNIYSDPLKFEVNKPAGTFRSQGRIVGEIFIGSPVLVPSCIDDNEITFAYLLLIRNEVVYADPGAAEFLCVQSIHMQGPTKFSAVMLSRVAAPAIMWAGASICVPICENRVSRCSQNPCTSCVKTSSIQGVSVPGNTGMPLLIVCDRSMMFIF